MDGEQSSNQANAVILAAGKSSKFFPPLYDKPKGLFTFRGEVLIERQIRQLQEAGVNDIYVVIGYEKERFFYLEEKFGVHLVVSERYNDEGNLSSLELVRQYLGSTYLCCADHWYESNPFMGDIPQRSVRLVQPYENAIREFAVDRDDSGLLDNLRAGAKRGLCVVGFAYLTQDFCERFFELLDEERGAIGLKGLMWEQFWGKHAADLPLYGVDAPAGFHEFDSLNDFQKLDMNVLDNVSQEAMNNICRLLKCQRDEIREIQPLNKGLTNVSFSFIVGDSKYVYRQPGASSSNMVNRDAEVIAQKAAIACRVDPSVIAIGREGWKLSRYIDAVSEFDYDDDALLEQAIGQIKQFHKQAPQCDYEINMLAEGERLMKLASSKKGDLLERYRDIHVSMRRLWHFVESDGVPKVLCHNDTYGVNWIVGADELCLIDWEYAGMNDPLNDIATLVDRDHLSPEKTNQILRLFFEHEPLFEERRHAYGCFALCGWYWFAWSLFKDTLGEDGFFMIHSWRSIKKYLPLALDMYENPGSYR